MKSFLCLLISFWFRPVSAQLSYVDKSLNSKAASYLEWFSWSPDSTYNSNPECSLAELGGLKNSSSTPQEHAKKISVFWDNCSSSIQHSKHGWLYNAFKTLSMNDDFSFSPEFLPVNIKLDEQLNAHGVLSLQPGKVPRPLIVLRLGVLGEAYRYRVEKFLTQIFFKELGYHVLAISNSFSDDGFLSQPELIAGGFFEAYQNMRIGEILLSDPELKDQISELRLVGSSLGGLGVLITSGIEAQWKKSHSIYKNFVALCPAVDLHKNFENLTQPGLFSKLIELRVESRLKKTLARFPDIMDLSLWPTDAPLLARLLSKGMKSHPLVLEKMKKYVEPGLLHDDFIEDNKALNWLKYSRKPVYILSAKRDSLVPVEFNTLAVSNQFGNKSNLGIIVEDVSEHCTFPVEAAWPFLTTLFSEITNFSK